MDKENWPFSGAEGSVSSPNLGNLPAVGVEESEDTDEGLSAEREIFTPPGRYAPPPPIDVIVKEQMIPRRKRSQDSSSDESDDEFEEAIGSAPILSYSRHQSTGYDDLPDLHLLHELLPPDEAEKMISVAKMQRAEVLLSGGAGEKTMIEESVEGEEEFVFCFPTSLESAREQANIFARKVWLASWKVTHFYSLPEWLQDNDYLHSGHRPPLPSFSACFKSIFRIHTETGNIWTHMVGCVAFIGMAAYFLSQSHLVIPWIDKLVFLPFFIGAVSCMGLSFAFHTVHCHSERVGKIFSKLDYVGIALLIMGSFIPWLYYGFYCKLEHKVAYMTAICILGIACIVVSLWDKFSEPEFRPLRAGLFMGLGLSALIPCGHYFVVEGFWSSVYEASMGWMVLMALLYLSGALLYAFRVPERFFPGKCDIMFQSHQIFHLLVVAAAFVHYHGVTEMAVQRLSGGSCANIEKEFFDEHTWEL